jgi:hypothetical protein
MLENAIDLLADLISIMAVVLTAVCIIGPIVAALLAVSHTSTASTNTGEGLESSGSTNYRCLRNGGDEHKAHGVSTARLKHGRMVR